MQKQFGRLNRKPGTLYTLTINVPVVFMARYVMTLRGATSLRGALEGVGPENRDFLGPEMALASLVPFRAQKSLDALGNDVAHLRTIKYKRHKNNWYIGGFMYPCAVVCCCVLLLCVVVCCWVLLCVVVCCCVLEGWGVGSSDF